ncbi:hypothetical protein [Burkholderia ubonensis]|uniref:hypothetical protein n=1 Tax=Burkholderia ubonensis TaxID=101571 RepID=UPI0007583D07|nr:hypothetical protein [Burkholderia ubonensis]
MQKNKNLEAFHFSLFWFTAGVACGFLSWVSSSVKWSIVLFTISFPVSWLTLGLVWILIGLFTLGQSRSSRAHHARNDFDNIARWVVRMFQEGVSMLLGLGVVAALAWLTKDDGSAAALTALSAVLAVSFQLFACCVHATRKVASD